MKFNQNNLWSVGKWKKSENHLSLGAPAKSVTSCPDSNPALKRVLEVIESWQWKKREMILYQKGPRKRQKQRGASSRSLASQNQAKCKSEKSKLTQNWQT